jgi:predicted ATPase/DNA-binding SARP family transcriptional activator/DNA-binding CsgD family transcriptional regulator
MTKPQRAIAEQPGRRPRGAPGGEPEAVRVRLLGGFGVSIGSRNIGEEGWRLKKAGSLLKLLALAKGHRLHRGRAMELLWPGSDAAAAANNLHYALHVARRTLEPAALANTASRYLRLRGDMLALCPEGPLWVDVEAFEEAAAAARRGREPAAYRAAMDLYPGELLPEDRYEAWVEERREELRGTYLSLLSELAALYEGRKAFGPAIEALQRVVAEEPSQEEAHAALMRLYALSGRRREALLQYEVLREALSRELDAEPGANTRRLNAEIRTGSFRASPPSSSSAGRPPEEPADSSRHNLPASLTSFVGREREIVEIKRTLSMTRLLTLTGAGGAGKTRLALEVARDVAGAYPDGAWLVELASLSKGELVPQAVAQALGVREQPGRSLTQTLSDYLWTSSRTLLVFDNCEHLVEATASLADALLSSCPKLRILATSREPLGVPGEVVWAVPPLSLPGGDQQSTTTVEGLMRFEALRLFVDRARSRLPEFGLTERNASAAARVCRRLEGIPLAIELAAARMGALAVDQVAQRLDDSLKLLTGGARTAEPRQRTLRATLDWSFELLGEAERALFGRLSVFAGGWTLEAAEEVCWGEGIGRGDVVDPLSRLVDKSLVVTESKTGKALRYRMLQPIRQYARERLEDSGEAQRVREQHARHYLALAERVEPELMGPRPKAALERLGIERDNLRAALSWALDADEEQTERAEMGLRLAAALGRFWDAHGSGEGRRWLEKGLAKSGSSPTSVRAKALNEAGFIAVYEGDPGAMALLEEGLALYKELGDRSGASYAISNLGHAVLHLGDPERLISLREEVEALLSEPPEEDRRVRAHLLQFLGFAAYTGGDLAQMGSPQLEEALALFRESGDLRGIATCLPFLGMISLSQRDSQRAAALFEEGLLLQRELKNKTAILFGLLGMAGVAALRGQPSRAAKLFGASEALREEIGLVVTPLAGGHFGFEGYLATARAGLGEAAFEAAFSEGRAMTPEQAIEYALSKEEEQEPPTTLVAVTDQQPPADERGATLTRREQEVALRVARGLTNRRIASELSISERTVHSHLRNILKKLGLGSRAGLAAWVSQRRPRPPERE